MPLTPSGDAYDMEALRAAITPKTKMLIVNNPGNPTGAVFTQDHLQEIADTVMDHS